LKSVNPLTVKGEKMNSIDLAKSGIAAMEAGNFDFIRDNCTDDMVFNAPGGMSLSRTEFINAQRALLKAFPDYRFNASNYKQVSDRVTYTIQVSGTHTGVLDMHLPNVPVLQPTNKHIRLPQEPVTVLFRDGKIYRVDLAEVPGGGLNGILSQVGVKITQSSSQK
jgi:hypothetical protein